MTTLAAQLDVKLSGNAPLTEQLIDHLQTREVLLIYRFAGDENA